VRGYTNRRGLGFSREKILKKRVIPQEMFWSKPDWSGPQKNKHEKRTLSRGSELESDTHGRHRLDKIGALLSALRAVIELTQASGLHGVPSPDFAWFRQSRARSLNTGLMSRATRSPLGDHNRRLRTFKKCYAIGACFLGNTQIQPCERFARVSMQSLSFRFPPLDGLFCSGAEDHEDMPKSAPKHKRTDGTTRKKYCRIQSISLTIISSWKKSSLYAYFSSPLLLSVPTNTGPVSQDQRCIRTLSKRSSTIFCTFAMTSSI